MTQFSEVSREKLFAFQRPEIAIKKHYKPESEYQRSDFLKFEQPPSSSDFLSSSYTHRIPPSIHANRKQYTPTPAPTETAFGYLDICLKNGYDPNPLAPKSCPVKIKKEHQNGFYDRDSSRLDITASKAFPKATSLQPSPSHPRSKSRSSSSSRSPSATPTPSSSRPPSATSTASTATPKPAYLSRHTGELFDLLKMEKQIISDRLATEMEGSEIFENHHPPQTFVGGELETLLQQTPSPPLSRAPSFSRPASTVRSSSAASRPSSATAGRRPSTVASATTRTSTTPSPPPSAVRGNTPHRAPSFVRSLFLEDSDKIKWSEKNRSFMELNNPSVAEDEIALFEKRQKALLKGAASKKQTENVVMEELENFDFDGKRTN